MKFTTGCILWAWTIAVGLGLGSPSAVSQAASVSVPAGRDNTIFSESTNSGGQAATLFAGRNNAGSTRRGLVWFDVATHVPTGATIEAVTLTLYMDMAGRGESQPREVALQPLLANWGEGTSGGGGPSGGQGLPPTPGDATWLHRFYDTAAWGQPGGDFSSIASGVASVGIQPQHYTWQSTNRMVGDVQAWLETPSANFGWIIIGDETSSGTVRRFASSEGSNPDRRPILSIEYTAIPEPQAAVLLCVGILLLGHLVAVNKRDCIC